MIGIERIASYLPPGRESNLDKLEKFAIDADFIRDKIGVREVSRKAPEQDTSDLCVAAFEALQAQGAIAAADLDCIVVCTQNPDGNGLPHTSAILHGKLGARHDCACFDIGLGCSGYVYGLSVVSSFMQANGFKRGALFTCDPYSKILDPDDKNTVLLFGDGATVTLLSENGPWQPHRFKFATNGALCRSLQNKVGTLEMNGRAVFAFSATEVPPQIQALLDSAGLGVTDIDRFFLHQGSKYIVDTIAGRLNLPADKVPSNLAGQGNTVSSSIPLLLEAYLADPAASRYLLCGFGVGLSWASAILERAPAASI